MPQRAGKLRSATPDDATLLTDLTLRSKASWGHDAAYMAAVAGPLTVTPERMAGCRCEIMEDESGRAMGFYLMAATPPEAKLDLLFIEPDFLRQGVGTILLRHALAAARDAGCTSMMLDSDPNAAGFYAAQGARQIGTKLSEASGARLPIMVFDL